MSSAAVTDTGSSDRTSLGLGGLIVLVLAIGLGYFAGAAGLGPIDRDEPRYTQATKQMIETGDYVRIRFQEAPRHKKPIGIHWLQAAAVKVSGMGADAPIWVYRVPSALGAFAALLLTIWAARAFLPTGQAVVAGALLGATIIVGVEAHLAKTDAALLATIVGAQGALARVWLGDQRRRVAALFWLFLGLGILVKGPIAPLVIGLTIAALTIAGQRNLILRLRPLTGVVITAAICLPWYIAIGVATDGAFYDAAIGRDFLGKATSGQEGHGAPPLTHLALFFIIAWPLAPFTVAALPGFWRRRGHVFLFALAWVAPAWVVFELVTTKLPHYTLPMYPAIAIATVAALVANPPPRWVTIIAGLAIAAVPLGATLVAPVGFWLFGTPIPWSGVAVLALAAAIGIYACVSVLKGAPLISTPVIAPTLAAALVAQAAIWGIVLPRLEPVWISERLVTAARAAAPCPNARLVSMHFREPSMIFLSGTNTALLSAEEAVTISQEECVVIAAAERDLPLLEDAMSAAGVPLETAGTVAGFNISKGDPVNITLFRTPTDPTDRGPQDTAAGTDPG
ncbi:MAG: glycosyltransferase family 39 protein [Pseudomonadota bacterium]